LRSETQISVFRITTSCDMSHALCYPANGTTEDTYGANTSIAVISVFLLTICIRICRSLEREPQCRKYRLISQSENAYGFEMELSAGMSYYFLQNTFEGVVKNETSLTKNSPELVMYLVDGSYYSDWKPK